MAPIKNVYSKKLNKDQVSAVKQAIRASLGSAFVSTGSIPTGFAERAEDIANAIIKHAQLILSKI